MAPLCSWLGKPSMAPPLFREVAAARERPAARGSSSLLCERLRARVTVDGMSYFFSISLLTITEDQLLRSPERRGFDDYYSNSLCWFSVLEKAKSRSRVLEIPIKI